MRCTWHVVRKADKETFNLANWSRIWWIMNAYGLMRITTSFLSHEPAHSQWGACRFFMALVMWLMVMLSWRLTRCRTTFALHTSWKPAGRFAPSIQWRTTFCRAHMLSSGTSFFPNCANVYIERGSKFLQITRRHHREDFQSGFLHFMEMIIMSRQHTSWHCDCTRV